ncbi:choice-of-anchor Q domain-containing protein [Aureibacillus halotolerans]|uniref:Parallel beta helix pectate lyase-like protein n=1 Tax=Aureibacillus halotolerans TaxID=1508390 RepID=A0A4R6U8U3_9BACI|nr:choice-of-anchor Q domain-containing protein [Aureibacillus halotolerans]TDQ43010.1 hypothetical protein EV213_101442 [Aureibacillus halotolerans]
MKWFTRSNCIPKNTLAISFIFAIIVFATGLSGTERAVSASTFYYVSVDGNNDNDGRTAESAWKTLQYASYNVPAGSTVRVLPGVYNEKLRIYDSGSASAGPITFTSYPNKHDAIIDGSGLSVGGGEGLIEIGSSSYVTIDGFEVRNYKTTTLDKVPIGIYVYGSGTKIKLLNNYVHAIESHAKVRDDLSGRDAHGIAVFGTEAPEALRHVTIDGNTLTDLVLGSSESLVVNGNVDTFAITNNIVKNNDNIGIDAIGFEGMVPDEAYDQARNGVIRGNIVTNITSTNNPSYGTDLPNDSFGADGIYVDGGKHIVIEQNKSCGNDIGIEIASEHLGKTTSDVIVRNNLVCHNHFTGIALGGYDTERGTTIDSQVSNNTLYMNDTEDLWGGQLLLQYGTKNNAIVNNIMIAGEGALLISNGFTENTGNIVDNNLYFTTSGNTYDARWLWKNELYTGMNEYQAQTDNDANSIFADPLFISEDQENFRIESDSPAIDQGIDSVPLGDVDYSGQPRLVGDKVDLGAFEMEK